MRKKINKPKISSRQKQTIFIKNIARLILFAFDEGYELTLGSAFAYPEDKRHRKLSLHYKRLAIDLNLFKDGKYLTKTSDHKFLGEEWKRMDEKHTWGGDFRRKDGNHYSYDE